MEMHHDQKHCRYFLRFEHLLAAIRARAMVYQFYALSWCQLFVEMSVTVNAEKNFRIFKI